MIKGRLLASVCALGLIVAAPALAAGMDNSATSPGMNNGTSMGNNGTSMGNNGASTGNSGGNWQHSASSGNDMRNGTGGNDANHSQSAMDSKDNGSMNGGSMNRMNDKNAMHDQKADNDHAGNSDMNRSRSAMKNDGSDRSRQAMGRGRGENDTSQNSDVDRLNDQSLQAAKQGHPFVTGSSSNGSDQDNGMRGDQGGQPGHTKM